MIFGFWDDLESNGSAVILEKSWRKLNNRLQPGYGQAIKHIQLIENSGYRLRVFRQYNSQNSTLGVQTAKLKGFSEKLFDARLKRVGSRWDAILAAFDLHIDTDGPKRQSGQPGPPPSLWSAIVSRSDGPTALYAFRFGHSNVFKLGISQNPESRLASLNFSVPDELLGRNWQLFDTHWFENGLSAYTVEQTLLKKFDSHKNERVQALSRQVTAAFENLRGQTKQ